MYIRKAAFEVGQAGTHGVQQVESSYNDATKYVTYSNKTLGTNDFTMTSASGAGQSSSFPCELTTITVTLQTNVPLLRNCNPTVTITGLNTDRTSVRQLPITNAAGDVFHTTGSYTPATYGSSLAAPRTVSQNASLVMNVSASTLAGTQYTVTFVLNNTNVHHQSPPLSVSARLASSVSGATVNAFTLDAVALPVPGTFSAQPLAVERNYWTHRRIAQSNPLPCAINDITVYLGTSVPLRTVCRPITITINGINQTETPDTDSMLVHGCSNGSNVFASTGVWRRATGRLTVLLEQDTVQDTEYCLRFTVKNKAATQGTPASPTATISGVPLTDNALGYGYTHGEVTTALIDTDPTWEHFVCSAIRYKIGHIPVSDFVVRYASQSNPFPCHSNVISFKLTPNVKLLPGTSITIAGLYALDQSNVKVPTQTTQKSLNISGPHAETFQGAEGSWDNEQGELVLQVAEGAHMAPCVEYQFAITVINPTDVTPHSNDNCIKTGVDTRRLFKQNNVSSITRLRVKAADICIAEDPMDHDVTSNPGLYQTAAGDSAPLVVLRPTWETRSIGQRTPYPYARNTITVTLKSNVPLVSDCPQPVRIEISGLDDNTVTGALNTQWTSSRPYRENAGLVPSTTGDIMLSPLQAFCVNPSNDTYADHQHFKNEPAGERGIAL